MIDNVAFYVLTFSFDVYGRFWVEKLNKNPFTASSWAAFFLSVKRFWLFKKSLLEPWSPNTSRYKKVQKTKNVPLDEIYLEYGLRFDLEFIV